MTCGCEGSLMQGRFWLLILSVPLSVGCMHIPLRNNSDNQARTVSDLYQQEVLNNLAMFVHEPNSLPYFSFANQGATGMMDQGTIGIAPTWGRPYAASTPPSGTFVLASFAPTLTGQRTGFENFTMTPVNDPRKLELMRCAYQKALASCTGVAPSTVCPDCQTRFNVFYTGSPDGNIRDSAAGKVTSECLGRTCWFGTGCKKAVPKECPCNLVGQYCDTYVWVLPGGQDELSKLTLAILDYAQNAPPQEVQKVVEIYLDERGLPTQFANAVGKVTAQVGITERNLSVVSIPHPDAVSLRDSIEKELDDLAEKINDAQAKNRSTTLAQLLARKKQLQGNLAFLDQQLKVGGLKEEYRQGFTPQTGPFGPLFINQSLNTLAPGR
ncbi:MAG: hypothetical protein C5B59_03980 [Bacteroidetes bacterium]|nr:MAG: hypothetical protein C5B59_03980 [Bacteroidota bacterium]